MQGQGKSSIQKNQPSMPQVHLGDYLGIIKKRKWVVIIFSAILISAVTLLSLISPHIYEATAKIIIERRPYGAINIADSFDREVKDQDFYLTQYDLLQSRSLAAKVIYGLKLNENMLHKETSVKNNAFASDKTSLVDLYLSGLSIEPVTGTHLVNIKFQSSSPEMSARAANAHAQAFIEWITEMRMSSSQQGLSWMNEHLKEQKNKFEESQRVLNDYKKSHGIVSFEDRQNIVSQKLMELNANLTKVKTERLSRQAVYEQLMSFSIEKESAFSLPEVAHDSVVQNLRNQLVQLQAKKIEMASNFGPKHPKMLETDMRIRQLEQEITEEVRRIGRTIKAELDRALAYERSLQQTMDSQKSAALSQNDKAIRYDVLQQDAQSNQKIYESLLKQSKELGLASAVENSNISIVDMAEKPRFAVKPKTFLNILLSIIVSLFMGPFFAFFFEYMDRTIKTPEDVQRRLGIPVFGAVPFYKKSNKNETAMLCWDNSFAGAVEKNISDKAVIVYDKNSTINADNVSAKPLYNSEFSDMVNRFIPGFNISRHSLYGKTLFIGSASPGEGKSTFVANSAKGLASSGLRVLVIDADIEHPTLHASFGLSNEKGLTTAMDEIFMHDIYHGNLNDYSIDDVLYIINLKKYTGRLSITNNAQSITADFENGAMFHIQYHGEIVADKLGDMLVRSNNITPEQLDVALDWNNKTGKPLGYVLINFGYITREKLQGIMRLQTEENIQKLFSWKHGDFRFEEMKFNMNDDEKIYFGDNYSGIIKKLSATHGNLFIEDRLFSNIHSIDEHNIHLLPVGSGKTPSYNPAFANMLTKFFEVLKRHYDIILIDAPPVIDATNAIPLASLCDGVLFVVKAGKLSDRTIKEATSKLQESGANILGVVLNQAELPKDYYCYYKRN